MNNTIKKTHTHTLELVAFIEISRNLFSTEFCCYITVNRRKYGSLVKIIACYELFGQNLKIIFFNVELYSTVNLFNVVKIPKKKKITKFFLIFVNFGFNNNNKSIHFILYDVICKKKKEALFFCIFFFLFQVNIFNRISVFCNFFFLLFLNV